MTASFEALQGEVHELEEKLKEARTRLQAICQHRLDNGLSAWRHEKFDLYRCRQCRLLKSEDELTSLDTRS